MEEDPTAFPLFLQTMLGVGLSVYLLPLSFLYYGFFRTSKSRMKEVVALQNLVHDMDVIERTFYKMAATGEVSKRDFKAAMEEATGRQVSGATMRCDSIRLGMFAGKSKSAHALMLSFLRLFPSV